MVSGRTKHEPGRYVAEYRLSMPHHWEELAHMSVKESVLRTGFAAYMRDNSQPHLIGKQSSAIDDYRQQMRRRHPDSTDYQIELLVYQKEGEMEEIQKEENAKLRKEVRQRRERQFQKRVDDVNVKHFADEKGNPVSMTAPQVRSWVRDAHPEDYKKWSQITRKAIEYDRELRNQKCVRLAEVHHKAVEDTVAEKTAKVERRQQEEALATKRRIAAEKADRDRRLAGNLTQAQRQQERRQELVESIVKQSQKQGLCAEEAKVERGKQAAEAHRKQEDARLQATLLRQSDRDAKSQKAKEAELRRTRANIEKSQESREQAMAATQVEMKKKLQEHHEHVKHALVAKEAIVEAKNTKIERKAAQKEERAKVVLDDTEKAQKRAARLKQQHREQVGSSYDRIRDRENHRMTEKVDAVMERCAAAGRTREELNHSRSAAAASLATPRRKQPTTEEASPSPKKAVKILVVDDVNASTTASNNNNGNDEAPPRQSSIASVTAPVSPSRGGSILRSSSTVTLPPSAPQEAKPTEGSPRQVDSSSSPAPMSPKKPQSPSGSREGSNGSAPGFRERSYEAMLRDTIARSDALEEALVEKREKQIQHDEKRQAAAAKARDAHLTSVKKTNAEHARKAEEHLQRANRNLENLQDYREKKVEAKLEKLATAKSQPHPPGHRPESHWKGWEEVEKLREHHCNAYHRIHVDAKPRVFAPDSQFPNPVRQAMADRRAKNVRQILADEWQGVRDEMVTRFSAKDEAGLVRYAQSQRSKKQHSKLSNSAKLHKLDIKRVIDERDEEKREMKLKSKTDSNVAAQERAKIFFKKLAQDRKRVNDTRTADRDHRKAALAESKIESVSNRRMQRANRYHAIDEPTMEVGDVGDVEVINV